MKKFFLTSFITVFAVTYVATANELRPLVDAQWLQDNAESVTILDVRGDEAYSEGHIPNSIVTNYGEWRVTRKGVPGMLPSKRALSKLIAGLGIDSTTQVVIVSGVNNKFDFGRAARVYWTFKVAGVDNVSILDGGIDAWERANGSIVTTATTPTPSSFTIDTFNAALLSTEKDVRAAIEDGTAQVVDARPKNFFEGFIKHAAAKIGGTILGSANISQFEFISSDGTLASKERIEELVAAANVSGDEPIISYCNTAHWAATNWFVFSEVLGYNTTLYDGSFVEWSKSRKNRKKYVVNTKSKKELDEYNKARSQ